LPDTASRRLGTRAADILVKIPSFLKNFNIHLLKSEKIINQLFLFGIAESYMPQAVQAYY
jgi:hypothetical protein